MRAFSIAGMVWLRSVCLVWIGLGWIGLAWASVAWAQGRGGWHGPGGSSGHGQWNGPQGAGVGWSGNWTGNAGGAWSGRGVGLWSGTAGWTNTWPGGWGGYSSWGPAGGWNVYPGPVISYPAWGYTSAAPIFVDPEVMGFGPRPPRLLPLLGPEVGEQLRNLGREEWVAPGLRRGAGPGAPPRLRSPSLPPLCPVLLWKAFRREEREPQLPPSLSSLIRKIPSCS